MDSLKKTTPKKLLLETTVQLLRVAGGPENRKKVSGEAESSDLWTTSFVLREFLRTIVKDLTYVHGAVTKLSMDRDGLVALANLDLFLASGKGNFSARSARRERYVTAAILTSFRSTTVSRQRLLTRLERVCGQWLRDFFELDRADGGTVRIQCLCALDEGTETHKRLAEGSPFPDQPSFPSLAPEFLRKNLKGVEAVQIAMAQAPSRLRDEGLLRILARLKGRDDRFDFTLLTPRTRGNWYLGDLMIALEAPPDTAIFSIDKHFEILCEALRRQRHSPPFD
jgi:hypothetical protein